MAREIKEETKEMGDISEVELIITQNHPGGLGRKGGLGSRPGFSTPPTTLGL